MLTQAYDPRELGLDVVRQYGEEAIVRCPYHEDRNPDNACFNTISGLFVCYSCGAGANVRQLAKRTGGKLKKIQVNISRTGTVQDQEWRHYLELPIATDHEYLMKRKVPNELIEKFKIRASGKGVFIPITNRENKPVGMIMRRFDNKPRYMIYGKREPLWPMHEIIKIKRMTDLMVVEGVFGALRGMSFGFSAAATLGAITQREVRSVLTLFKTKACFDHDYAGFIGAARLLIAVPTAKIVVPGQEMDELDEDEWDTVFNHSITTTSIEKLARLSGKPDSFKYSIKNFSNQIQGRRQDE